MCFFPQRGFFALAEGHYFIEPVQKSSDDPAGSPEPHIIYPRVSTQSQRKKRSLESKKTPNPCGVRGVYVNSELVCGVFVSTLLLVFKDFFPSGCACVKKDKPQVYCK